MMERGPGGHGDFNARQTRLAEIFDEHGWPGWQLVGEDGSTAAWLIVQHADLDVEFQRRGLGLLEEAVAAGDASPGDLAYLVDRVRVADGQPQVYGTQWTPDAAGEWQPRTPIEDEANVDARRAEAGPRHARRVPRGAGGDVPRRNLTALGGVGPCMKRMLGSLVALVAVMAPSAGHAGGWAVATMDPLPAVVSGEAASIGFRLLQHGRTPVDAAEWPGSQIGVAVRAADEEWFVPAEMDGGPGHFVASVDVPEDITSLSLSVQMTNGLIVEEEWVDVGVSTPAESGSLQLPAWTLPLLAIVVLVCAAVLVVDLRSGRRTERGRHRHHVTWRSAVAAVGLLAAGAGVFAAAASARSTAPTSDAIDGAGLFVAKGCALVSRRPGDGVDPRRRPVARPRVDVGR